MANQGENKVRAAASFKVASVVLCLCLFGVLDCAAQAPRAQSTRSFTSEQMEVYRSFLAYWNTDKNALFVSKIAGPLIPDDGDYSGCMRGFTKGHPHTTEQVFSNSTPLPNVTFVDPATYNIKDVTSQSVQAEGLDQAVTSAINAGLLTFSEVLFSPSSKSAAVNYGLRCGRLCGSGATVIYERTHRGWRRSKRHCGSWIS